MKVSERVFIVTGGASGLGAATVRRLAGLGGRIVIADLADEAGQALAAALGSGVAFVPCDVTSAGDVSAAVQTATQSFGGLHGLINCAGIGTPGKVLGKDGPLALEAFERVVRVNLAGSFNTLRLAAQAMARMDADDNGERGVIINTASIAAYDGQIGQCAYSASKGGIVGMTLPAARELARHGIRVLTIAPGLFETPMMAALPAEVQASLGQSVPFPPRLGRPDEYAALVQHIVENSMLNGETIRLDGALRMAPK